MPTILRVVCRTTGMRFAAVARVTEERWVACEVLDEIAFGLKPGGELQLGTTICNEIRASGQRVVIDHVAGDELWRAHPTPATYGFQSYISVPILRPGGEFFGTLCAIDPLPRSLNNPDTIGMFTLFADLIGRQLDAQDRMRASEAALADERRAAELREQFIAVLGHDLRDPLSSIEAGTRLLAKLPLEPPQARTLELMRSSVRRMATLIEDVLDLARGRLGGGLAIERSTAVPLRPVLEQVIAEFRASWPSRVIEAHLALDEPVDADRGRIAQLLANLLSNALAHGAPAAPIVVRAAAARGVFTLSVANAGEPIPTAIRERLFQPFFRASGREARTGLGLGLYIASEIARSHGGRLEVTSGEAETCFTLVMPTVLEVQPAA